MDWTISAVHFWHMPLLIFTDACSEQHAANIEGLCLTDLKPPLDFVLLPPIIRVIISPGEAIALQPLGFLGELLPLLLLASQEHRKRLRDPGEKSLAVLLGHHLPPGEKGSRLSRQAGDRHRAKIATIQTVGH